MAWRPTNGLLLAAALSVASCAGHGSPPGAPPAPPAPPAVESARCDRYAAPSGHDRWPGTRARPFRSVERLARALAGGGTGCMLPGWYHETVRIRRGGRDGRPLVLRGEDATLAGTLWIDRADHVKVTGLVLDGSNSREIPLQVMGDDVRIEGNAVTTSGRQGNCVILGSIDGYGRAQRTTVRGNRFDRCGDTAHGNKDHAVYVENARDGEIVANTFTGTAAYAVQLYPNAQRMRVGGNVMRSNGGGVIIAGDEHHASSGNVIEGNLITGSKRFHAVQSYWGGREGTGNIVRDNCLWGGVGGALGAADGFTAYGNLVGRPGPRCAELVSQAARHRPQGTVPRRSSSAS